MSNNIDDATKWTMAEFKGYAMAKLESIHICTVSIKKELEKQNDAIEVNQKAIEDNQRQLTSMKSWAMGFGAAASLLMILAKEVLTRLFRQ